MTVAIPTFNGSRYLRDALESVSRQTYEPIEILVVDDASDDDSAEIAEEFKRQHPEWRMEVLRNPRRLGLAGNWNRCVELAKGEYLKFVFQDDLLEPECIAELVRTIEDTPTATMAFAPRTVLMEESGGFWAWLWMRRHGVLHTRFSRLDRVNDGRRLFLEQMRRDPFRNWIGEPTVVLTRTASARGVGGFNPKLKQLVDVEMWLRLMCRGAIGFIDRPLATYRLHQRSATSTNLRGGAAWLDPAWMAEALLADPCVSSTGGFAAAQLRARAVVRVLRGEAVRVLRGGRPAILDRWSDLRAYRRAVNRTVRQTTTRPLTRVRRDPRPDESTVAAVVVTHHPNPGLAQRLANLRGQIGAVILVDNGSTPSERSEIREVAAGLKADLIENDENLGLAAALNQGLGEVSKRGFSWALTLDQDSTPAPDLVPAAALAYDTLVSKRPAVIGARFVGDPFGPPTGGRGKVTTTVITSGALHSVAVWDAAGRFRADFFIDSVDTEYCLRARALGHAIGVVDRYTLSHSIGRPTRRHLGPRWFVTRNHDRTRWYYITRNRVITWRLYLRREPRFVLHEMHFTFREVVKLLVGERDRRAKLAAVVRGLSDGFRGVGGRMP